MKTRVIKFNEVYSTLRFDGSYHNAEANVYDKVINQHSEHKLSYYCSEIFTSGRNKRVYTSKEYGYPFLSNSDVVAANPFMSCNYSSKKYGYDENAVLKEGMILTGRVGAIGQTAFVPAYVEKEKAMGSDNIIRICVKPEFKNGFIYAYLASRIGNLSFWKHATGGVQPFITDAMVGELPIPSFPNEFQREVDDLIQESAKLREEAMDALKEAHSIIELRFDVVSDKKSSRVSIQSIMTSHDKRFEASYYVSYNRSVLVNIINGSNYTLLKELTSQIFKPNIFKREYVQKNGYQLIGGADMLKRIPSTDKMISRRQVNNMPSLKLKRNYILITRAGTIGNVAFVDKQIENLIISEDVLRVVPNDEKTAYYLYAFLSSTIGKELITLYTYGSVIQHIESQHLELVPIPNLPIEEFEKIVTLTCESIKKTEIAKEKELRAIKMVEEEIEKWNN